MTTKKTNTETHVVMWRGAGSDQTYRRSVRMSVTQALEKQAELKRMGYRAYIIDESEEG